MGLSTRSEDTVREDFKDMVNNWIEYANTYRGDVDNNDFELLNSMAIKLQSHEFLTKPEAMLAKKRITELAINDMEDVMRRHKSEHLYVDVLLEVDCMSLYADITEMFLRPGTYRV